MLRGLICGSTIAAALMLAAPSYAAPIVVNFATSGPAGILAGTSYTDGVTGVTMNGFFLNGGSWTASNGTTTAYLFRRNDGSGDRGLGVCTEGVAYCGTGSGHGDYNELSNNMNQELLRLTLPAGYQWVNLQLSSLDNNGSPYGSLYYEHGQIIASSSATPTTNLLNLGGTLIDQVIGGVTDSGNREPVISLAGYSTSPYIYLEPYNWQNSYKKNNDFLLYQATVAPIVPEPPTLILMLLGTGLAGLYLGSRKLLA